MSTLLASPRKYDIRVVDKLYADCQAAAEIENQRASLVRSWHATKRIMWTVVLGSSFLYLYLMNTMSQAMALL